MPDLMIKELDSVVLTTGLPELRIPHSALERLFSGIQFGMDDWGNLPLLEPKHRAIVLP